MTNPEAERKLAECRKECEEQARLNGMGGEVDRLKEQSNAHRDAQIKAEAERDALIKIIKAGYMCHGGYAPCMGCEECEFFARETKKMFGQDDK